MTRKKFFPLAVMLALVAFLAPATAEDRGPWEVRKSSGEVWVTTGGVQPASLDKQTALAPGDKIRTGRNGRVLLVRGEESILIAPNSDVGIPQNNKDGLPTTISQRAGSILLDVEQRNVKHFEVETPYLAAVVKGTQFRVTVDPSGTKVDVIGGRVEVSDYKSGKFALVMPGQAARVMSKGSGGLLLSGQGKFNPIQQGTPRPSGVTPMPVPSGGFSPPKGVDGQRVEKLGRVNSSSVVPEKAGNRPDRVGPVHATRITSTIGVANFDLKKATNGLVRSGNHVAVDRSNKAEKTVWNSNGLTPGNGVSNSYNQGNSGSGNSSSGSVGKSNAGGGSGAGGNGLAAGNSNGLGQANGNAFGHANGNNGKGKGKGRI